MAASGARPGGSDPRDRRDCFIGHPKIPSGRRLTNCNL
jgi:hypothetical protein